MIEFKGTPGPWVLDDYEIATEEDPANLIAHVYACDRPEDASGEWAPGEKTKANAALISAAPRIYAALARLTQAAQDANVCYLDAAVSEGWDALEEATSISN